jgi:N-acetylmuramoyl-L-alanine amidase
MNTRVYHIVTCLAVLAVLFSARDAARAKAKPRVERARYSVQGDRTRVVLDLSGRCEYNVTTHKNPDRIAVNIPNTRAGRSLGALEFERGVVDRVRVNRLSWGTQVVLDLQKPASFKDFSLAPNGNRPERIVLDVFEKRSLPDIRRSVASAGSTPRAASADRDRLLIVVLDPGHGGRQPGTTGLYGLVEKKITLDISRRIAERINKLDGFKAVLTRNSDITLGLRERVQIAARKNADIFVSIHLNSAPNRSARGTEVFFISPGGARVTASHVLANPDRAASDLGLSDSENADLLHMLVDVNQQSVMMRSELLAESILESMRKKGLPPTRSVKQKSYSVLRTIEMPSVLVEAAFLTNSSDAKFVRGESGRQRIAEAIANGIVSYFSHYPPPRGERKPAVFVHKVKKGESLWKISRRYGTTVASILETNNLRNASVLHVGQELIINRY